MLADDDDSLLDPLSKVLHLTFSIANDTIISPSRASTPHWPNCSSTSKTFPTKIISTPERTVNPSCILCHTVEHVDSLSSVDSAFQSSSLAEKHLLKAAQQDPIGLVQQTTWRLLRTYPDGLRQDSSNQDPVHAWNFGVQMAALNYQNNDDMMAMCHGKFLDNGCCGYVRKPEYLINAEHTRFNPWDPANAKLPPRETLIITIVSAQFLSPPNSKTSDIPDPYVHISIHGLPCDTQTRQTRMIDNNGLNPTWNETFDFPIRFPEMSLIHFTVYDHDVLTSDDRIAFFCLPVTLLRPGKVPCAIVPHASRSHSRLSSYTSSCKEQRCHVLHALRSYRYFECR